jgi:hypothetical protein
MTGRVVQIDANPTHLFALCDDGKIFQLMGATWSEAPAIPQSTEAMVARIRDLAVSLDLSPAERAALEAKLLGGRAVQGVDAPQQARYRGNALAIYPHNGESGVRRSETPSC